MNNYFKASSWDPLLQLITIAVCTFSILFIIYNPNFGAILFFGALVIIPPFFTVRGYSLEDKKLVVHRLGWVKEIDLKSFKNAEVNNQAMKSSWRLLGNGGLFGWIGTFSNKRLGTYRAYVSNRYQCVILELENKKIVISPDSPDEFINKIEEKKAG